MNVIELEEARFHFLKKRYSYRRRMLGEFIEYCLIPGYEELLDCDSIDRIPVAISMSEGVKKIV